LGEQGSIHLSSWPKYDADKVIDEEVTIAIQINGKVRAEISIKKTDTKEDIEAAALLVPKIQEYIKDKKIEKIIVVPGRIVNIVVF
jgi:leucyl-tRNA synthetase